jgi:hypothetical protein
MYWQVKECVIDNYTTRLGSHYAMHPLSAINWLNSNWALYVVFTYCPNSSKETVQSRYDNTLSIFPFAIYILLGIAKQFVFTIYYFYFGFHIKSLFNYTLYSIIQVLSSIVLYYDMYYTEQGGALWAPLNTPLSPHIWPYLLFSIPLSRFL